MEMVFLAMASGPPAAYSPTHSAMCTIIYCAIEIHLLTYLLTSQLRRNIFSTSYVILVCTDVDAMSTVNFNAALNVLFT